MAGAPADAPPIARQNATRGEELDAPPEPPEPVFVRPVLVFKATLTEPDSAAHFLGTGGALSAAAAPWTTSFAVSGDDGERMPQTREPATVVTLKQNVPTVVRIPLSPDGVHDARDKVLIENQRQGCGINGTYGSFYAGAGAQTVGKILRDAADGTPTSISLTYAGRAQDGVVTIFGAKIEGSAPDLQLLRDTTRTERAMAVIKAYLDRAWMRRTVELPSTNPELAKLTKVLCKTNVGVHESCYSLVHDNLDCRYPFPLTSLEDLFAHTLRINMGPANQVYAPTEDDELLKDAAKGGLRAARHADRIATAVSQIVCYLMPYKSDGYGYLAPGAPSFVCAESWLRRHASPISENDCENAAKLAISIFETIRYDPAVMTGDYPHLKAVYNIIVPYYTWGLSIVGAGGAEASSSGSEEKAAGGCAHKALNGHAIALLIPTAQLLTALDSGARSYVVTQAKTKALVENAHSAARGTRFDALFPRAFVETHYAPNGEGGWYESRRLLDEDQMDEEVEEVAKALRALPALSIEGTTPASGWLCGLGAPFGGGDALAEGVRLDNCGEAKVGPTIGRCLKMLAAGTKSNRFYQEICEFHVPATNPLYADSAVRASNVAASQFIFSPMAEKDGFFNTDGRTLEHTGISVLALKEQRYYMVPLSTFSREEAEDADYGALWARRDEMPRDERTAMGRAFAIAERETGMYKANVERLLRINSYFRETPQPSGTHTLLYMLPLAALVNNTHGIEEFCTRIEKTSVLTNVVVAEKDAGLSVRGLMETTAGDMDAVFVRVYAQFVLT